jgi:hypothetical protein
MFEITPLAGWSSNLLWLGGVALAAFLVSWLLTDRLHLHRAVYVGALTGVAGGLAAWYTVWASAGSDLWTNRWVWGILGGVVAGLILDVVVHRALRPQVTAPVGSGRFAWETAVYGIAEGLLLSVLPVVITWQILASVQWTSGWRAVGAAVAVLLASVAVIVVHHLGYAEFRSRKMAQAVVGCGVLSLAGLLTGSPVSATLGHVLLHAGLLQQGQVLPPNEFAQRGGSTGHWVAT